MTDSNCIFCKISSGQIPSKVAFENDEIFAFHDIAPVAPVHVLIIPKKHIVGLNDLGAEDVTLLGNIMRVAQSLAKDLGIDKTGYRVVNNCGSDGGQTVHHLHFHLLGGRSMTWPPG
ncbi:MAG: histidine triad nucleotide-binding protein [Leptospira sp.]|nr:histidine triad nucleotide-binding protein [Leptospira sp.]